MRKLNENLKKTETAAVKPKHAHSPPEERRIGCAEISSVVLNCGGTLVANNPENTARGPHTFSWNFAPEIFLTIIIWTAINISRMLTPTSTSLTRRWNDPPSRSSVTQAATTRGPLRVNRRISAADQTSCEDDTRSRLIRFSEPPGLCITEAVPRKRTSQKNMIASTATAHNKRDAITDDANGSEKLMHQKSRIAKLKLIIQFQAGLKFGLPCLPSARKALPEKAASFRTLIDNVSGTAHDGRKL